MIKIEFDSSYIESSVCEHFRYALCPDFQNTPYGASLLYANLFLTYKGYVPKSSNLFRSLRFVETYSDPAWRTRKSPSLLFRPSKHKIDLKVYLKAPVKPVYKPPRMWKNVKPIQKEPKFYPFHAPRRRPDQSDDSYAKQVVSARRRYLNHCSVTREKALERYSKENFSFLKRLDVYNKKVKSYNGQFDARLRKYRRRLLQLEKRKEIVRNWHNSSPFALTRPSGLLNDQPYRLDQLVSLDDLPLEIANYLVTAQYVNSSIPFNVVADLLSPEGYDAYSHLSEFPHYSEYQYGGLINRAFPQEINVDNIADVLESALDESFSALMLPVVDRFTELDNRLIAKLTSKVRSSDIHIGNILAERYQTYQLFGNLVKRLSDVISGRTTEKIFKGLKSFIRNPKKIADDYLAFKFGVEPLLSDIHGAAKTLAELDSSDPDWFAFRVNNRMFVNHSFNFRGQTFQAAGYIEVSYVVKYAVTSSFARSMSQIGLINPAEILWEKLPWSFVVDWALPIGKLLHNYTGEVGLEFLTGTKKVKFVGTCITDSGSPTFGVPIGTCSMSIGNRTLSGNYARVHKRRTVLTALPSAPDVVLLKKNPITSTHLFESLALFFQRLKG